MIRIFPRFSFSLSLLILSSTLTAQDDSREIDDFPKTLSEWKLFVPEGSRLKFREGTLPYKLVNELFTDYARKVRTIWLPPDSKMQYKNEGPFEFPDGAIISKTFSYARNEISVPDSTVDIHTLPDRFTGNASELNGKHLIETRLLINSSKGWTGLTYVWNDEQTEAFLKLAGSKRRLSLQQDGETKSFWYHVPNFNQCQTCHAKQVDFSKIMKPIGPQAKNANFIRDGVNQLDKWQQQGKLEGLLPPDKRPWIVSWQDSSQSLNLRARAYLNINCAHCHNGSGAAKSSGLLLGYFVPNSSRTGICKSPVAAGSGGYGGKFDIVPGDPDHSILYNRMRSVDPGIMMPELGRSLPHVEADRLIHDWIQSLVGSCQIRAETNYFAKLFGVEN